MQALNQITNATLHFQSLLTEQVGLGFLEKWGADLENYEVISFSQAWSSTALGFGGIGGQAITSAQTTIFTDYNTAYVYIGGGYAYTIEKPSDAFWKDVAYRNIAEVSRANKYRIG